ASCPWYAMHLNTDSFTASSTITINANDVNFSGMPTCAMTGFQQTDVGIWAVQNDTAEIVSLPQMSSTPFSVRSATQNYYYSSTDADYAAGVSEAKLPSGPTITYTNGINPGQRGYISLCSLDPSTNPAIRVYFANQTGTVSGALDFDGRGNFIPDPGEPRINA